MGNLVNATGTRLGWFQNWKDSWYASPLYYGEYLYAFFRMRYYLVYFYNVVEAQKRKFYSHFTMNLIFSNIAVSIYYYDSSFVSRAFNLEYDFYDILDEFLEEIRLRKLNSKRGNSPFLSLVFLCSASVFRCFCFISSKKLVRKKFKEAFRKYIIYLGRLAIIEDAEVKQKGLFETRYLERPEFFNDKFLLMISIFYNAFSSYINHLGTYASEAFINIIWLYNTFINWERTLTAESVLLSYIFRKMTCFEYFDFSFWLLSNNEVTGVFLSRFIAKRLALGVNLKTTINPIKGDLFLVHKTLIRGHLEFLGQHALKSSFDLSRYKIQFKSKWYQFLSMFLLIYRLVSFSNYLNTNSWLTFDNFLFLKWLTDKYGFQNKNNLKVYNKKNLVFFTRKYWLTRNGFFIYFLNKWGNSSFLKTQIFVYFKSIFDSYIHSMDFNFIFVHKDFHKLYDFIIIELFINFNSLISFCSKLSLDFSRIQFINLNYNLFMFNNYLGFSYKAFFLKKNIVYVNAIKARSYKNNNKRNLLKGFKMHCSGRFSRRQRAGSVWYSRGRVPLNTFSVSIDYGAYTIPLENSEICVKVWLNVEGREYVQLNYEAVS